MKNFLVVSNVVLLILVAVLFYLHFSGTPKKTTNVASTPKAETSGAFKIAYFEMDSIENNYEYLKDIRNQLKTKEQTLYSELSKLKNSYMQEVNKFNQEAPGMSQEKAGSTQQELMQKQKRIQDREQAMGLEMQDATFKKMQEVNKRIESFLADYNTNKNYSYILAYQPGTFYYKDSSFNITADVLRGLNDLYKKKD
ncbi:OmpH family outer membrane protein [Segetibacter sp. 3557_3]|uniref:OmpH family outer membrane protein n=1 Tax=Segetibacter sp. 3557_3 TaxID=2547429 RepID=UPI0010587C93|nr:OmpH family outer membrane protein [Segetibacter sp. 3557_3]TDH27837.1 OmpH family outer membrane protein [Segetibacter sp. 3557_3]